MSEYRFDQLVDIGEVQQLLESHHRISGMACGLMDMDENIIVAVGLQELCTTFHWNNADSLARCWRKDPDTRMKLHSQEGEIFEYRCENGMIYIAMPVVINGRHLSTFFAGQFFYADAPPDTEWFRLRAIELGFDTEQYLQAVRQIPLFSRTHVEDTVCFLRRLVQLLVDSGMRSRQLASEIEKYRLTQDRLALITNALDLVPEAAFLIDDQSRFLHVNREACRTLGYGRDELTGMKVADIDTDYTPERTAGHVERLLKRESITFETRYQTRDGRIVPVEIISSPFDYGDTRYVLSLARDIIGRKRMEEKSRANIHFLESMAKVNQAIRETNELQSMMRDVLDVVLSVFDCDRAFLTCPCDPGAKLVSMERSRAEYTDVPASGESMPMNDEVAETLRIMLNSDGPVKFGPGGSPLPSDVSERFRTKSFMATALYPNVDKPWQFGIHQCSYPRVWTMEEERLFQEIGRRLEGALTSLSAYRDLRESEARYRQIVDAATEGIWVLGPDTMTTFVNAHMAEMLGCSVQEMIGRPASEFMFEEDVPDHLRKMENRRQGMSEYFERRFRRKDGQAVWTHVSATSIFDADHHFNGGIAVLTDITERRKAEETLRESEERYRLLFALSPDLIIICHQETIVFANPAAVRMSGLKCEEELIGRSVLDFFPPGRLEEERKRLNSNLTNGKTTQFVEMNLQQPDGSHVEVEMASVPFRYRGKEYIQIVAREISDRKRYEETLLQQARLREQLSGLAEAVPGFLYTFRIDPDGTSSYPYASSGVQDLFGLRPEEIREDPAPLRARYHPDDLPGQRAAVEDSLRECKPFRKEMRIINPDKGELWVEIRSTPQRRPDGATEWHGLMIDITERKRMEEMLAAREREFRSLAENIPDIIARYDQCGRTLYINPSFEKTIGMPLKDVLEKTSRECKQSDCFDEYADMMEHVAATGEVNTMELNVPDGNGGSKHYQINFVPECDQKGDIIGVLAIGRDITELRRSSQRILEKQKRLNDMALELSMAEDRERRRIATELHDTLGQDLTLARMRLGRLTNITAAEEQKKVIDEICYSIDGSIHHVRSLIWTINPPILESAGLEAALKWLGRQVEADYSLQVEFLDDLQVKPLPRECRMEIYNAVRELLINVAKHAGTDMALVSVCREEDNLTVRVKDEGIGFVPDIAANDPANDGFGLFNIHRRINHLGGSFEIDSAPGKGARVTIRMPLADMRVEA